MEYRLYIFLINFKYLQDVYKKDLEIQFENIKDFFVHELKTFGYKLAESDNRSLVFKTDKENDFKSVFQMAKDAESISHRLKSLLKDFEGELFIKHGIMTLEESDKRHAFRWSFSYDEIRTLPDILLTDKAAFSIIENFDVRFTGLKNLWTTAGVEVSRAQRIRKIYFNREEENDIEDFITKDTDEQVMFVYGDNGSGKSATINEVVKRTFGKCIIHLKEKKHSTKEFKLIHELIFNLLFVNKINDVLSNEEVISTIENSSLPVLNKENLIYLISSLYGDNSEERVIVFEYGNYRFNLQTALYDTLKITQKKCVVIIDDHQWMSRNCEEMFLSLLDNSEKKIKLIIVSDDKNNSNNIKHPVKLLRISEVNKVQISKLLLMAFPHTKIAGKTADFIHKVTGGNLYTVISYVQYLIDKDALKVIDGKVDLQFADPAAVPDNLSDIFSTKISSLSENALTMLKILSIIGEQFFNSDLDWLLHTLNYPYDETSALNELEEKGIIENSGDFYIITEPSVMNEIYKTINEPNRKLIHKLLAELFETKGYGDFGFKVFFHLYRAENYEKLFEVLPELIQSSHTSMHFNALKNMLEISDKLLFKLCMKENLYPAELWQKNLISTKWLFDKQDPIEHVKRFEKAIDYLVKIDKKELAADLYDILLMFYIQAEKLKKAEGYLASGLEIAGQLNLSRNKLNLLILKAVIQVKNNKLSEAAELFVQIDELKKSPELSELEEGEFYLFLKAMVLNYNNDTGAALTILKGLLDKYSAELNFGKINSILKLLIELSIRSRDYKSAEEYCKFMLNSSKDFKDNNNITGNILLAKLYSYQNKFLQSISMLESVIDSVKDDELYFSTVYSLGSIYQFYAEKEMALKTFLKAFSKIKDAKSEKLYLLSMKLSLISAYDGEYEQALTFLKSCKNCSNKLYLILTDIIKFQSEKTGEDLLEKILKDLNDFEFKNEPDLAFETELILLKILFGKRKFIRCRELTEFMNKQSAFVEDFNLALEYQKLSKNVGRNTAKAKKNIPNIRKVSPSVKKRVKNRRSN